MDKKDYEAIAGIIKKAKHQTNFGRSKLANNLADYFEREDKISYKSVKPISKGNFNRKQFLKECGVDENEQTEEKN